MKTIITNLTIISIAILLNPQNTNAQCHIDDWNALKALYESTDGDNWRSNTNWEEVTGNAPTSNCNLENLYRVGLDAQGRVDDLNLHNNQLIGSIPALLGNLSNLEELKFYGNELIGSIPPELGNLSKLYWLNLGSNELIGSIPPELGNLSNLKWLYLNNNQLIGSIPPELGNLSNLEVIEINDNDLSGCYSDNLAILCTQLTSFWFDGDTDISVGNNFDADWEDFCNNADGSCNPQMANCNIVDWYRLKAFYESTNGNNWTNRTGWDTQIVYLNSPPANCNLSYLFGVTLNTYGRVSELTLSNNYLTGTLPREILTLSNLELLNLSNNSLTGNIPSQMDNLSNLLNLNLSANELNGFIPSELGNFTSLNTLNLSNNQLAGSIPRSFSNLDNLNDLKLNNNLLSGCYPLDLVVHCNITNNVNISSGNSFNEEWSNFCGSEAGACGVCSPVLNVQRNSASNDCSECDCHNTNSLCNTIISNLDNPLATEDCDGDGAVNLTECLNGCDPFNPIDNCGIDEGNTVDCEIAIIHFETEVYNTGDFIAASKIQSKSKVNNTNYTAWFSPLLIGLITLVI